MKILDKVKKITKKAETEKVEKTEKKNTGKEFKKNKLSKDKVSMIMIEPLFTEKISNMLPLNKYAFKVTNHANKIEVKKAIEGLYEVNVVSVNMIKTTAKPKRVGRREMMQPGFKKAIVTIKSGEVIEPSKIK
ncbi:MAG: 50S ribosomal protein L23 [Candidatus Gracilibacteria bacterium]|jgi:large subunit ribosomal protein L23